MIPDRPAVSRSAAGSAISPRPSPGRVQFRIRAENRPQGDVVHRLSARRASWSSRCGWSAIVARRTSGGARGAGVVTAPRSPASSSIAKSASFDQRNARPAQRATSVPRPIPTGCGAVCGESAESPRRHPEMRQRQSPARYRAGRAIPYRESGRPGEASSEVERPLN